MEMQYRKSIIHQSVNGVTMETEVLLPALGDTPKQKSIGRWGLWHKHYLMQCQQGVYSSLFLSGKLDDYLLDIDRQANEMYSRLVERMTAQEGITERLKADNQMEWVRKMNDIDHTAKEIVLHELIYC